MTAHEQFAVNHILALFTARDTDQLKLSEIHIHVSTSDKAMLGVCGSKQKPAYFVLRRFLQTPPALSHFAYVKANLIGDDLVVLRSMSDFSAVREPPTRAANSMPETLPPSPSPPPTTKQQDESAPSPAPSEPTPPTTDEAAISPLKLEEAAAAVEEDELVYDDMFDDVNGGRKKGSDETASTDKSIDSSPPAIGKHKVEEGTQTTTTETESIGTQTEPIDTSDAGAQVPPVVDEQRTKLVKEHARTALAEAREIMKKVPSPYKPMRR